MNGAARFGDGAEPDRTPDPDIEAAFAAIVAGWDAPSAPPDGGSEGDDGHAGQAADAASPGPAALPHGPAALPPAPPEPRRVFEVAPPGWRVHVPPEPEPEDEEFEPPDPPLPGWDPLLWCAVAGIVLGPVLLIMLVLFQPYGSKLPMWLAAGMTAGGLGILLARLPGGHDDDDDGARV